VVLTQEQLEQGIASGMMTGLASSFEGGIVTDASLELRKASGTATAGATPALYTVLEQQDVSGAEGLVAVGHTYRMPGHQPGDAGRKRCASSSCCAMRKLNSFFIESNDCSMKCLFECG
jgi:hypothetical protein